MEKSCDLCGTLFHVTHGLQLHCPDCRTSRSTGYREVLKVEKKSKKMIRRTGPPRIWVICAMCGKKGTILRRTYYNATKIEDPKTKKRYPHPECEKKRRYIYNKRFNIYFKNSRLFEGKEKLRT